MKRKSRFLVGIITLLTFVFSSCNGISGSSSEVKISQFSFALTSTTIEKGDSCLIKDVYIFPDHATNKKINYSIENTDIASIDGEKITGLASGETKVKGVTTDGSNLEFSVPLTVTDNTTILVDSINLSFARQTYDVGEAIVPTVQVNPSNATNNGYTLEATPSDSVIITENSITAIKAGEVFIKAKAKDSSKVESNTVSLIFNPVSAKSISVTANKTKLYVGDKAKLTVTVSPTYAEDKQYSLKTKSGNNDVISISSKEEVIAMSAGKDSVIAYLTNNPSISFELPFECVNVEPTGLVINLPSTLYNGDVYQATVDILPSTAPKMTATYRLVSGSGVISVSSTGLIEVLGVGNATIEASLVERPNIKNTLSITAVNGNNPSDPYGEDIF